MGDAELVETRLPRLQVVAAGAGEGNMVEPGTVWVESLASARVAVSVEAEQGTSGERIDRVPEVPRVLGEHRADAEQPLVPRGARLELGDGQGDVADGGKGHAGLLGFASLAQDGTVLRAPPCPVGHVAVVGQSPDALPRPVPRVDQGGAVSEPVPMRVSSVVFGREDLLALGHRRLDEVQRGVGGLLFLAGEAGIGKSRLLREIAQEAENQGIRVIRAAVFPGDLELSGGLLLDLAHELARSPRPAEREVAAAVTAALTEGTPDRADAHRRRRLLVLELADLIARLSEDGSTMLALEDLHWADDLALEVLAQLARRLPELPLLVVGTYRSNDLFPRVPMRDWRSRLLSQRLAEESRLPRLDPHQIAAMTTLLLGGSVPAARDVVELISQRSNGIPLHVEELLAASASPSASHSASTSKSSLTFGVPETLRDAVLQSRSTLSEGAAEVAGVAAVVGRSFDLPSLAAVADAAVPDVASGLHELIERAFVEPTSDGWYEFRHVLIRDALESAVPLARRRELHARVAVLSVDRPDLGGAAYRSAHEEAAGNRAAAHALALSAAEQASGISNHREALALYRRAVRCAPADVGGERLAALLNARGAEAAASDDNTIAAQDFATAYQLWIDAGKSLEAVEVLPFLVSARHLLGDGLTARSALLEQGLAVLSAMESPAIGLEAVRGRLYAALAEATMLDLRLEKSMAYAEHALTAARAGGDEVTELDTSTTLGAILVHAGRGKEGWSRLEEAVSRASSRRWEGAAARAYRVLGASSSALLEYPRAERWLREGIDYAERTEQWNHRHFMAAHLGHVLWASGRWAEAGDVVEHAMADGRGGLTTLVTALHVRGFLALGRGRRGDAVDTLDEAVEIGERMNEVPRISPALWGLAEQALLDRRWADASTLCERGRRASAEIHDAAYLYPLLVPGTRALIELADPVAAELWVAEVSATLRERSIPGTLPAIDHARGLLQLAAGHTGLAYRSLRTAMTGWQDRHRTWESQWAALDLARCAYRSNRGAEAASLLQRVREVAADLGAAPLIDAAAEMGARHRRQDSSAAPWAPLTAREFEVAQLITAGRTNREIGVALHVTAKTAATHVEHILLKLGAGRRAEIAAWVADVRLG